ncbi:VPS10 domain-containing protein [Alicyclobacillus sp. ALC3]|uniref:VPS10 domain-containing protein n=1 Tax=Alicyclobacillus sp. ALC3 TaxID=2796143 RepID=UPI002378524F|nr:hypothetical protein [Alicyclobacillus sp. ALC3]WDL98875.1 hypothetical protein JC200_09575 [Alicyclobacillus sp. ALC3]
MNRHIPLIATAMIGISLVSGCAKTNSTPNHTVSNTASVQTQSSKVTRTATGVVKKSAPNYSNNYNLPSKPDEYIAQPEWVTNKLVYVIGWDKPINPTSALFVSHNAGKTWTKLKTPLPGDIQQVHFQTPTTGIIYGARGQHSQLAVYRTIDGGAHWAKVLLPASLIQGAYKYGAPQVTFVTLNQKLTWFMAMWNDNQFPRRALYHSNDNGITWTYANNNSSISAEGYLSNFYAPDSQTAYFVSFCPKCGIPGKTDMTGTNTLEITHDAGNKWMKTSLPFTGENRVQKLVFTNAENGTATVKNVMSGKTTKYATTDGGHHWSRQ